MKTSALASIFIALSFVMASCSSTTIIQSEPPGARLYLNGVNVGRTPYAHRDTRIVGSSNTIRLEKEGYAPLNAHFYRDEQVDGGALVAGIFLWIPFLWIMEYHPVHFYELQPLEEIEPAFDEESGAGNEELSEFVPTRSEDAKTQEQGQTSPEERLKTLKKLYEQDLITKEEYEAKRQNILKNL